MALAEAADGGIAGHRTDGREAMGDQRGVRAHPRGGRGRGFAAGMAAADDDDVKRNPPWSSSRDFYRGKPQGKPEERSWGRGSET